MVVLGDYLILCWVLFDIVSKKDCEVLSVEEYLGNEGIFVMSFLGKVYFVVEKILLYILYC